jgi:hypothetical protein
MALHELTCPDTGRTIRFEIQGPVALLTGPVGNRVERQKCTVEVARQFYAGLRERGWLRPDEPIDDVSKLAKAEREMQRMEAEGDRAQTAREERAKVRARTRKERMTSVMRKVG